MPDSDDARLTSTEPGRDRLPGVGVPSWVFVVALLGTVMTVGGVLVGGNGLSPARLVAVFGLNPAVILGLLVASAGRRPRLLLAASIAIDIETLLIAGAWTIGPAFAILLPLVGLVLALGGLRDRALRAAFVLAATASFAAVALALLTGPLQAERADISTLTTLGASALLIAFSYGYLWRLHDRLMWVNRRAEEEIGRRAIAERQTTRLATAVEHANDVVFVTDTESRVLYANPAFERVTGYPVKDALGRDIRELVRSGLHDEAFYADLQGATASGRGWSGTITNRRRDGSSFDFEVALSPIRNDAGAVVGSVAVGRDRSDAQALERALRESEARFRTVVELAPEAVRMSRAGVTLYGNRRYRELFGFGPDEDIVGRPTSEVWAAESRPMIEDLIRRRSQGNPVPPSYEATGQRLDGSRFPVLASVSNVTLPDGPASISFLRDLTEVRQAHADLDLHLRIQAALLEIQPRISDGATADVAADLVCEAMSSLPGVDFVAVYGFTGRHELHPLAHRGPDGFPPVRDPNGRRDQEMRERVQHGPYSEAWRPADHDGTWGHALAAMGIRAMAFGPIVHGDHVDGMLGLATADPAFARTILDRLPEVIDFSATPSALLAERMHERREQIETRARIARVIASGAFEARFQPIVDLATREVVGYEALTRFRGRQVPHAAFADAWRVGLGPELELATLARAIADAERLPSGRWLDLNISPDLLIDTDPVRELIATATRPIVLEITEQQFVADYEELRARLARLGSGIRLAVDDAGAGTANFNHIVELRPDLVKLDMSLVREVNINLGRQALVIAMNHFGRTTGCRLVAEGIETEEEADTLRSLGVEYGQGYLLGRPELVEAFVEDAVPAIGRKGLRRIA